MVFPVDDDDLVNDDFCIAPVKDGFESIGGPIDFDMMRVMSYDDAVSPS